jgi:hypothetical protein
MRFDEAGLLGAFDAHRDLIYATAAKVYARSHRGSYDLDPKLLFRRPAPPTRRSSDQFNPLIRHLGRYCS